MNQETIVWKVSPSQWGNAMKFFLCGLFFLGTVPVAFISVALIPIPLLPPLAALVFFYQTKCTEFELTNERLKIHRGIFTRTMEEIELYRVKDTRAVRPFPLGLFGLGNIEIFSGDKTTPTLAIECVKQPMELREQLRRAAETRRDQKGVRVRELE